MKDNIKINKNYFYPPPNIFQKILSRIYNFINGVPPDWIRTPHNTSFMSEESFIEGYQTAVNLVGLDYNIPWRIHQAQWAAHSCLNVDGDFIELGTGQGFVMLSVLGSIPNWNLTGKRLLLYDAFAKYNASGLGKAVHNKYYAENIESVSKCFNHWQNIFLIQGDVRETILADTPPVIAFLHVDLNDAKTEVILLKLLYSKVSVGGIILLDDYANYGEEATYYEMTKFFENVGQKILTVPSGQGIVIKR